MQNEIKSKQPLLAGNGSLAEPGWCRRNLYAYNIGSRARSIWRLKEWDFYQISNGRVMVQLNLFNISLATCATFGLVDLQTGEKLDTLCLQPLTPHKNRLNPNGDFPNRTVFSQGKTHLLFNTTDSAHNLQLSTVCGGKPLRCAFHCARLQPHESITIATPFAEKGCFFYTNKINCLATEGVVTAGEKTYKFSKSDTFTVLDWGRGIWPHKNMWYWANGSTYLNGVPFGFELTWGFGDESAATETALFYGGVCHKLGAVSLEHDPQEYGWMRPWHFREENGRLDLTMTPFYDNVTDLMPLGLAGMKTHQVHGLWNGTVVLDDGKKLQIENMYAFCEKVHNKW